MSDESQSNKPLELPSEQSPEPKLDQPIGETEDTGSPAENVGSPIEDDGREAGDLDEL